MRRPTYKQVSRLGMPLVNEVVIPMGLKDVFNTLSPNQDLGAYSLLQKSVENPEIGTLLCALYSVPLPGDANKDCSTEFTPGTPRTGRGDIFDVFLTGMKLAKPFTITTKNGPVTLPGRRQCQPTGQCRARRDDPHQHRHQGRPVRTRRPAAWACLAATPAASPTGGG